MPRSVLKIGGSVITDKAAGKPTLRRERLEAIVAELAALPADVRPVALVHGAGSFGHLIVAETRIHERVETAQDRLAWAMTQVLQNELNAAVCRALIEAGIPALPLQASAAAVMANGRLDETFSAPIMGFVDQGLVPVLYGVPAFDRSGRSGAGPCSILSGDLLAPWLAKVLGCDQVVYGTDVDGVYDQDPRVHPQANHVERIDRHNWEVIRRGLGGASTVDVTGGMAAKVEELVGWAKQGISSRIVDATKPGRLASALSGGSVGTLIEW